MPLILDTASSVLEEFHDMFYTDTPIVLHPSNNLTALTSSLNALAGMVSLKSMGLAIPNDTRRQFSSNVSNTLSFSSALVDIVADFEYEDLPDVIQASYSEDSFDQGDIDGYTVSNSFFRAGLEANTILDLLTMAAVLKIIKSKSIQGAPSYTWDEVLQYRERLLESENYSACILEIIKEPEPVVKRTIDRFRAASARMQGGNNV